MKFSLITSNIKWYIDLMSLRSRFHVNISMVLTREGHLFIHKYKVTSKDCNTYFNGSDDALIINVIIYFIMFILSEGFFVYTI